VTFVWHVASGKTTWSTYTEANGNADRYQDIGDADYGQVLSVDAHVTVNGQTVTRTCEFTATRH